MNVLRYWTDEVLAERFREVRLYAPLAVDRGRILLPPAIQERVVGPNWPMLVWENLRLAPTASVDVLFCPSYSRPLHTRSRTVITMFESTLHLHPELYPRRARLVYDRLYGWSARHATLVVTSSEAARRDIGASYGVPEDRIRVVYLGCADSFGPLPDDGRLDETRRRYVGSSAPFFLYVGKLTARRNIPKLMEAFAEFKRRSLSPYKLVVIGMNTTNLALDELAGRLGIRDGFVYREYVPDDELNRLYNAAEAFVLPYTYEAGFSLTALEAQATGTPVLTVDTPGLRESTGSAALLIPEAEVRPIADGLARLAADASLRAHLSERGLANARRFSWERCSAETLAVLAEAARNGEPRSAT